MRWITASLVFSQILVSATVFAQTSDGSGGTSGVSPGAASGGALGTSAGAPGTNSLGTAAPSGSRTTGAAATGTGDPQVDKQDKDVDKKIKSICKGC